MQISVFVEAVNLDYHLSFDIFTYLGTISPKVKLLLDTCGRYLEDLQFGCSQAWKQINGFIEKEKD